MYGDADDGDAMLLQLALLSDSSHVFYSCGEDAVVFQVDLRQDKPNKYVITSTHFLVLLTYCFTAEDPSLQHTTQYTLAW